MPPSAGSNPAVSIPRRRMQRKVSTKRRRDVDTYMSIYIYIHGYIHTHIYIYIYICKYMYVCMYVCMYTQIEHDIVFDCLSGGWFCFGFCSVGLT